MLQGSVNSRVVGEIQEGGLDAVVTARWIYGLTDFYSHGPAANSPVIFDPGIQLPLICRNSPGCSIANMK